MKPLNLSEHPPRKPSERLGDVIFMARTVDKMRASLPGGNLGLYKIPGFSTRMLNCLGVTQETLQDVVASAESDADVEHFIYEHTTEETRAFCNAELSSRTVGDFIRDSEGFLDRYPLAKDLPPETPIVEMLDLDDQNVFAAK